MTRIWTTLLVSAAVLAGCGGSEEEQIAADACDLLEEVVSAGPESLMDGESMSEYQAEFEELESRAADADVSDAEMEQAMRDECPQVFEELEGMFEPEVDAGDPGDDEGAEQPEGDADQG